MHRLLQPALHILRHGPERQRHKALHITGATAIELAVFLCQAERIGRPILAIHRHDIHMAGQHDSARLIWPGRDEQIGLQSRIVIDPPAL